MLRQCLHMGSGFNDCGKGSLLSEKKIHTYPSIRIITIITSFMMD